MPKKFLHAKKILGKISEHEYKVSNTSNSIHVGLTKGCKVHTDNLKKINVS